MKKNPSQMVDFAVLALLRQGELHGYQIRKSLAEMAGPLFQFSFGSLYPALSRLTERGAVDSYLESGSEFIGATGSITGDLALSSQRQDRSLMLAQGDRGVRTRRVYRITDVGEKLYQQLMETAQLDSETDFMAWLYLANDASTELVTEKTRERLAALESRRRTKARAASHSVLPDSLRSEIHSRLLDLVDSEIGFVRSILNKLDSK